MKKLLGKLSRKVGKDRQKVLSNFFALGLMQGANFILPLLTIPYLTRVIGVEKFGLISWVQVLLMYMTIFIDYGFQITATREVSISKGDRNKISQIFSKVYTVKILLTIFVFMLLLLLTYSINSLYTERWLVFLGFGLVLGQALTPIWFFQGVEKMFYITLITVSSKSVFTLLVFILIQSEADYIYVLFYQGIGWFVAGLAGIILAIRLSKLSWIFPSLKELKTELKEGFGLFLSQLSIFSYINANLLILGFIESDKTILGYYSIAEKIMVALRQLLSTFSQAIYPHICQLTLESHQAIRSFYKKMFLPFLGLIFLGSLTIFIFAPFIITIVAGEYSSKASLYLRLMAFIPFIVGINIPFNQTLLAYNLKKQYVIISNTAFILNIFLNIITVIFLSAVGSCISILITEFCVTFALGVSLEYFNKKVSILFYQ